MVNKQVMGERKGGEVLGEGRTNSRWVLGGFCTGERAHRRDTVFGGAL